MELLFVHCMSDNDGIRRAEGEFRFHRLKLPKDAFAISEGDDSDPSDLVQQETWSSIVSLPDDVSLRTSDHYGSALAEAWRLWNDWIGVVGAMQSFAARPPDSPICYVSCNVIDHFQASVYSALVGFYRLAFSSLRAAVEAMTVGLSLESEADAARFAAWLQGEQVGLGVAADYLAGRRAPPAVRELERALQDTAHDDLFHQRSPGDDGGLVRRHFRALSGYVHGGPSYTDADMWESNGPIFVPGAFEEWWTMYLATYALVLVEAKLAQPALKGLSYGVPGSIEDRFVTANTALPDNNDARRLLANLPNGFWRAKT